jgi:mannose-1-phosphate guanylyltransferase
VRSERSRRSRATWSKQALPLAEGQTLLQLAYDRRAGIVPSDHCCECAGETYRQLLSASLGLASKQYLGEPMGRDTVNALGFQKGIRISTIPQSASMEVCRAAARAVLPAQKNQDGFPVKLR